MADLSFFVSMAIVRPLPTTLLSLPRYAQYLAINPVHFSGGHGNPVWSMDDNQCQDIWPRYAWQNGDHLSLEDLAYAIKSAEDDVARFLGYWPAPKWFSQEIHPYPQHYRRNVYPYGGVNVRGGQKSVRARWGKFISQGRRAVTLVGTATTAGGTLVYSDADGDGFIETATITLPTALTNVAEIKAYYAGTAANPGWEIRPARSITISGGNVVLVFDSWLLITQAVLGREPTADGFTAILLGGTTNLITSIDIYREYTDTTAVSAEFLWEPDNVGTSLFCAVCNGTGCTACMLSTQNGCLHSRNADRSEVVPTPATYDSTDAQWETADWAVCRDPDMVKLWYRAGLLSEDWLNGYSQDDPLDNFMAQAIAYMATARVEREFCQCANVSSLTSWLRADVMRSTEDNNFNVPFDLLGNPFGARRGEVIAWQKLSMLEDRVMEGALV